jgi:tetratricopeptide (TPR) repeat protein
LSYKASSSELNELHLTFNAVARTLNLATESLKAANNDEKRSMALLSYADAYKTFEEFGDENAQKGVCLAGMGSIMLQMGDYDKAMEYYKMSEDELIHLMRNSDDFATDYEFRLQRFSLAIRRSQFALAGYTKIRSKAPYGTLFEDKIYKDGQRVILEKSWSKSSDMLRSADFSSNVMQKRFRDKEPPMRKLI